MSDIPATTTVIVATDEPVQVVQQQDAAAPTVQLPATTEASEAPEPKPKTRSKNTSSNVNKDSHGAYTDENNIRVPKRKVRVSKIFYAWAVKHGEPVDITKQQPVCLTHFTASAVARIFAVRTLRDDGKVTGRRDVYLQERGVNGIKTNGYVVTRRRNQKVKEVFFKKDKPDSKTANFSISSTQRKRFLDKKNLKHFRQQIMSQAGLSQEEIDAVETETDTPAKDKDGNIKEEIESDMDSGDDIPANADTADLVDPEDDDDEKEKIMASQQENSQ